MTKIIKAGFVYCCFMLMIASLSGCKNNDPSVLKIFVRSSSNELQKTAEVVIIGDPKSSPATLPYVDTLLTNASGFATFNMDSYFNNAGGETVGYFDVVVKKNGTQGTQYVRCRQHITTVETVFLN
jgi:hypothetical protein